MCYDLIQIVSLSRLVCPSLNIELNRTFQNKIFLLNDELIIEGLLERAFSVTGERVEVTYTIS